MGTLFFGTKLEGKTIHGKTLPESVVDLNKEIMVLAQHPLNLLLGPIYTKLGLSAKVRDTKRKILEFRAVVLEFIRERKQGMKKGEKGKTPDLVGLLLEKQAELGEKEVPEELIVDTFVAFLSAGVETMSNAATMLCYLLSENPDVVGSLETEIGKMYNDNMTLETLNKMEYTAACFQEGLRLLGPGKLMLVRIAVEDHMLGDIKVKKGTMVFPELEASDFNPMYNAEPEKFVPERWLKGGLKENKVMAYSFSSGPRNCIGKQLALIEGKVFVAEILKRFSFKVSEGYKLRMTVRLTYEPEEEVPFDLERKEL